MLNCKTTIQKIAEGGSNGLNPEKLNNHRLFSARIDGGNRRLLYTTVKHHGETALLILDVVYNHEYKKSRFMKPEVLKTYLRDINANPDSLNNHIVLDDADK